MMKWITNDPEAAAALAKADREYEAAREAASGMTLADKVLAYTAATVQRQAAYKAVTQ